MSQTNSRIYSILFTATVFLGAFGCINDDRVEPVPTIDAGNEHGGASNGSTDGDEENYSPNGFDAGTDARAPEPPPGGIEPDTGGSGGRAPDGDTPDADSACPDGKSRCSGSCVNLSRNANHCGQCNRSCGNVDVCRRGSCGPTKKIANVISETNEVRSSKTNCGKEGSFPSAPPLQGNAKLHAAAQKHADDMASNNFFDHTGSDGSKFQNRIRNAGFGGRPVAENIAAGNSSARATVRQWKNSPGHCANIMKRRANRIGVGVARGGKYGWYWVQVFGRK